MATLILPGPEGAKNIAYEVALDGRTYGIDLRWNDRDERWHLTVSDADGVVLRSGVRVVANWPLLRLAVDPRLPPGELVALRTGGDADPTLAELGTDVPLVYVEASR